MSAGDLLGELGAKLVPGSSRNARCTHLQTAAGRQLRCVHDVGHEGEHELQPPDSAAADLVRRASAPTHDRITVTIVVDGRTRVATFIDPAKIKTALEDAGTLGAFLRSLRDSK